MITTHPASTQTTRNPPWNNLTGRCTGAFCQTVTCRSDRLSTQRDAAMFIESVGQHHSEASA